MTDRLITIACWSGIAFFGFMALVGFATQGASTGFLLLSFAGFCSFPLLRRAENRARSQPVYAPLTPPVQPFDTPQGPPTQPWTSLPPTPNYAAQHPLPIQIPGRVTQKWLAENVPRMNSAQVPGFLAVLRARGWSEAKIQQKVAPLLRW